MTVASPDLTRNIREAAETNRLSASSGGHDCVTVVPTDDCPEASTIVAGVQSQYDTLANDLKVVQQAKTMALQM